MGAGGSITGEDVLGLLVRLVDASLVLVVAEQAGDEDVRYRLLEPLRQYAEERLEADDAAEAERLWAESLDQYTELGDPLGIITIEIFRGNLAMRAGDVTTARARYAASLAQQRGWRAAARTLHALAGLAVVAGAEGDADRALRLAGAQAALGEAAGFRLPEPEQVALDRAVAAAQATLGERTAAAVWAEGQALSLEEAIAVALQETIA